MFKGVIGEIVFEEMKPETYKSKFWEAFGGYDEEIDAQLASIDAIETARQNGHSPEQLAEIVKSAKKN